MKQKKKIIYTILVMSSVISVQNSKSAYLYSKYLVKNKFCDIHSIFFYNDGVFNSSQSINENFEDLNLALEWYKLSKEFFIDLNICSTDVQNRGIIPKQLNQKSNFSYGNMSDCFKCTGLGSLVTAILTSDRFLQF